MTHAGVAMAKDHVQLTRPLADHLAGCAMGDGCPFVVGWRFTDHAVGMCVVCGHPARSRDPEDRVRHLMCKPTATEVPA